MAPTTSSLSRQSPSLQVTAKATRGRTKPVKIFISSVGDAAESTKRQSFTFNFGTAQKSSTSHSSPLNGFIKDAAINATTPQHFYTHSLPHHNNVRSSPEHTYQTPPSQRHILLFHHRKHTLLITLFINHYLKFHLLITRLARYYLEPYLLITQLTRRYLESRLLITQLTRRYLESRLLITQLARRCPESRLLITQLARRCPESRLLITQLVHRCLESHLPITPLMHHYPEFHLLITLHLQLYSQREQRKCQTISCAAIARERQRTISMFNMSL